MIRYTRDEIDNIRKKNIKIDVSDDILEKIKSIVIQVGSPTYIKTPLFTKKRRNNKQFETIPIPNKPAKTFGQSIMELLNKLNDSNYDLMKPKIIDIIIEISKSNDKYSEVVSKIYELVSFQSFNIKIYGKLFKDIVSIFPEFKDLCLLEFENYIPKFVNIKCTGPENYDLFCEYNEKNDSIRCLCKFYIELYANEILDITYIINLIIILQTELKTKLKDDNIEVNENPCVEYTENVFTLIVGTLKELVDSSTWEGIYNSIIEVKSFDKKIYKNMNSKIKFKHMDLIDIINKN
jgi:hypothetical protein